MEKTFKNRMFKVLLVTVAVTVFISSSDTSIRTLGSSIVQFKSKSLETDLNEDNLSEDTTSIDEEATEINEEIEVDSEITEEDSEIKEDTETTEDESFQDDEEKTEETEEDLENDETEEDSEETEEGSEEAEEDKDETEEDNEEIIEEENEEDANEVEIDLENIGVGTKLFNFDGMNLSNESKEAVRNGAYLINFADQIDEDGEGFTYELGLSAADYITLNDPSIPYVLTGKYEYVQGIAPKEYRIIVADNGNYDITFDNVSLYADFSAAPGMKIGDNTTVNLNIVGDNTITAEQATSKSAGIHVPETSKLTIGGSGKLTAIGGDRSAEDYYLLSNFSEGGAGIGSNSNENSGTIVINSGTIVAIGNGSRLGGAGIGSGYNGNSGPITINGGVITAIGGGYTDKIMYNRYGAEEAGAGIGAGGLGSTAPIIINGGTITATGGAGIHAGAGIGGSGKGKDDHNITINGGKITARGGGIDYKADFGGAGIGSGGTSSLFNTDVSKSSITINGGSITATGGGVNNNRTQYGAAGIGGGAYRGAKDIYINDSKTIVNIVAKGGGDTNRATSLSFGGSGIGGGSGSNLGTETRNIRIIGSSPDRLKVESYGGGVGPSSNRAVHGGAAIGAGSVGSVENITIVGANVKAYGSGYGSAGIGSGNTGSGATNIVIGEKDNNSTGTIIDAKGSLGGAGIGSGRGFRGLDGIYIYGANTLVTADGNASTHSGAGIGGGAKASTSVVAKNINIYNGTIKAYGSLLEDNDGTSTVLGSAGIGSGAQSPVSNINIYGGNITAIGSGTSNHNIATGGAGIGSGASSIARDINIYGGTIEAIGGGIANNKDGYGGAGIGGGYNGFAHNINLKGGTIVATGGGTSANGKAFGGAGVGAGFYREAYDITIDNVTLTATGGGVFEGGAGIGDGARLLDENKIHNSNIVITDTANVKAYAMKNYAIGRNDSASQLGNSVVNAYVAEPLASIELSITPFATGSNGKSLGALQLPANYTAFGYTADLNSNYEHRYSMNGNLTTLYVVEDRIEDFVVVNTSEVEVQDTYRATELITREFYDVTFDENGGSYKPDVQHVMEYKKAVAPKKPTKAGYRFLGWFDSENNQFDFDTLIVSNVSLKAKWDEVVLDVSVPPTINRTFASDTVISGRGIAGSEVTLGITISSLGTTTTMSAITVKEDNTWSVNVPSTIILSEKDKLNAVQLEVGKSISTGFSRGVIGFNSIGIDPIPVEPTTPEEPTEIETGNPYTDGGDGIGETLVPGTGTIDLGNNEVIENFLADIDEDNQIVYIFDEEGTPLGTVSFDEYIEGDFENFIPLGTSEEEEVISPIKAKANPKTGNTPVTPLTSMIIVIFGALLVFNKRKNFNK